MMPSAPAATTSSMAASSTVEAFGVRQDRSIKALKVHVDEQRRPVFADVGIFKMPYHAGGDHQAVGVAQRMCRPSRFFQGQYTRTRAVEDAVRKGHDD